MPDWQDSKDLIVKQPLSHNSYWHLFDPPTACIFSSGRHIWSAARLSLQSDSWFWCPPGSDWYWAGLFPSASFDFPKWLKYLVRTETKQNANSQQEAIQIKVMVVSSYLLCFGKNHCQTFNLEVLFFAPIFHKPVWCSLTSLPEYFLPFALTFMSMKSLNLLMYKALLNV